MGRSANGPGRRAVYGRLVVGADGKISATRGWVGPACEDRPLAELFAPGDREAIERVRSFGWLGVDERLWTLADRVVAVAVVEAETGATELAVHDLTTWEVVEQARTGRRQRDADADLAGGLARELTDPMAVVQGRMELLLELGVQDPAVVRRHLEIAVGHARRVTATLRNLRSVGRTTLRHAESTPLAAAVDEALTLVGPRSDRVMVRIEPQDLAVSAEHPLLVRVLSSLVRLALETSGRTAIHLRATRLRSRVLVRIGTIGRDTGKALSPEIDLSLDRALLGTIGADLQAFPTAHGVSFDLSLAVPSQSRSRARKRTRTLWVVGSQPLCDAVTQLLCRDDYQLRTTSDPGAVLAADADGDGLVAELLGDRTPSGLGLARWYRDRRGGETAEVPCVLVVDRHPATSWPDLAVVTLPLSRSALLDALRGRSDTGGDPQG